MPHENILDPARTALAVVDVQESFRPHIPDFAGLAARVALVAQAARLLNVPVVVTEQYPKGLGRSYQVPVLTDCVSSRAGPNRRAGLDKMMRSGALPSSTELALFELMRDA